MKTLMHRYYKQEFDKDWILSDVRLIVADPIADHSMQACIDNAYNNGKVLIRRVLDQRAESTKVCFRAMLFKNGCLRAITHYVERPNREHVNNLHSVGNLDTLRFERFDNKTGWVSDE